MKACMAATVLEDWDSSSHPFDDTELSRGTKAEGRSAASMLFGMRYHGAPSRDIALMG